MCYCGSTMPFYNEIDIMMKFYIVIYSCKHENRSSTAKIPIT